MDGSSPCWLRLADRVLFGRRAVPEADACEAISLVTIFPIEEPIRAYTWLGDL